jgi:Zn-dependent peptidase ImmA (M78 family)/transcriptional regulator with XRE-family HTH domain
MNNLPDDTFGRRLAQARQMRGLPLRKLAAQLDGLVTPTALNKYEQGQMMPGSEVLVALAGALGQSVDYFFRPFTVELKEIEFRKRSTLGAKDEKSIKERASDFFERYLEVEELLGLRQSFEHPLREHRVIRKPDDIEAAAKELREAWQLGLDPISNIIELLEQHGIKVWEIDGLESFDGFSGWAGDIPVIVLNCRDAFSLPRRRLTALHELAHLLLDFEEGQFEDKEVEKLCHAFAAAVLMLREVFECEFGGRRTNVSLKELIDLKARYGISIAAIMARAVRLGLIAENYYKGFCIKSNRLNWRHDEPGEYRGEEHSRRFEQLLYRAAAEECVSLSKAASLAGKSLAEFRDTLQIVR